MTSIRLRPVSLEGHDEQTIKNPIRDALLLDREVVDVEAITGMVAAGRDFFHSFISQTVRRRYKRPPIYLVDSWVTGALGLFTERSGVLVPDSLGPGPDSPPPPFRGIGAIVELFDAINELRGFANYGVLLSFREQVQSLRELAQKLVGDPNLAGEFGARTKEVVALMVHAWQLLRGDGRLGTLTHGTFDSEADERIGRLLRAANRVAEQVSVPVPGISFDPKRGSGLLIGGIPELGIEGPAILLAPVRIRDWAEQGLRSALAGIKPVARNGAKRWLGVEDVRTQLPIAIGLANVVQHELTHAMVALPNDPVQGEGELSREHFTYYVRRPEVEEGLANFTAAVATVLMTMKASCDVQGTTLPILYRGKYADLLPAFLGLMKATYAGYHEAATDIYINAWEQNKRDYGAFAGFIKLFATNFSELNWDRAFQRLSGGEISTSR